MALMELPESSIKEIEVKAENRGKMQRFSADKERRNETAFKLRKKFDSLGRRPSKVSKVESRRWEN